LIQTLHKIVPLTPILSQMSPVNNLTTYFIKFQSDDISEAIQDSCGTVLGTKQWACRPQNRSAWALTCICVCLCWALR